MIITNIHYSFYYFLEAHFHQLKSYISSYYVQKAHIDVNKIYSSSFHVHESQLIDNKYSIQVYEVTLLSTKKLNTYNMSVKTKVLKTKRSDAN